MAAFFPSCEYACDHCQLVYSSSSTHKTDLRCLKKKAEICLLKNFQEWLHEEKNELGAKIHAIQNKFSSNGISFRMEWQSILKCFNDGCKFKKPLTSIPCQRCGSVRSKNPIVDLASFLKAKQIHEQKMNCRLSRYDQFKLFHEIRQSFASSSDIKNHTWNYCVDRLLRIKKTSRVDLENSKSLFHLAHLSHEDWNRCLEHFDYGAGQECVIQSMLSKPYDEKKNNADLTFSGVSTLIRLLLLDPRNRNLLFTESKMFVVVKKKPKVKKRYTVLHYWYYRDPTTEVPKPTHLVHARLDSRLVKKYKSAMIFLICTFAKKLWKSVLEQKTSSQWRIDASHFLNLVKQTVVFFGVVSAEDDLITPTFDMKNKDFQTLFLKERLHAYKDRIPLPFSQAIRLIN
jgi:ribosomal protein S27E